MKGSNPLRVIGVAALVIGLVFTIFAGTSLVENVDASEIVIIQSPVAGTLTCYSNQGLKWQGFGKATSYQKRGQYEFDGKAIVVTERTNDGPTTTSEEGARITFNDGAESAIAGSIQYDMPLDCENLKTIHTKYGSQAALENQLVEVVVDKAIFLTGNLLSSRESYAERRADMIRWAEDQINDGVYQTQQVEVETIDQLSGERRTSVVAEILRDQGGQPVRQEGPQLAPFGITPRNFAPTNVIYPQRVREQIATQQENIMAVETKIVEARQAEQDAITAEQQGRATAARARWEQEAIKARLVTEAEQRRDVAALDQEAADYERQANILRGEGEAERKRLVMEADGALQQKLDALIAINRVYAENFGNLPVPSVIMGSDGNSVASDTRALDLIDLLTAKAAQDLGLDLTVRRGSQ